MGGIRNVLEKACENINSEDVHGNYGDIDDEAIYNVALPSFLAGSFHQNNKTQRQVKSKGIFDDDILSHVPGDKTIYQAMRDWVKLNSPIHQEVEGRFTITSIDGYNNKQSGSDSRVPSILIVLLAISMAIF